jgi:hypothetical protein
LDDDIIVEYDLELSKAITNSSFFRLAEACGWIEKLLTIIDSFHAYAQNHADQ